MIQTLRAVSPWHIAAVICALLVALPILLVGRALFIDGGAIWQHLVETVLLRYITGSLVLAVGAGLLGAVLGTATAWLVTAYRFPGAGAFAWLLILPLAVPSYVLAYAWTDLLEYAGPVQSALRTWTGWGRNDYWFPDIRSHGGAVLVLGCTLYPYVYISARAAFLEQGSACIETARSLGAGAWGAFARVALPLARPGIVAGTSLVVMEALADFGTVHYFGIDTFTTGIYRTWEGFYDYAAATRLAAMLLLAVFVLIVTERLSRGGRRYHRPGSRQQQCPPAPLHGWRGWLATLCCAAPVLLGFGLPTSLLLWHCLAASRSGQLLAMLAPAGTSLALAGGTALLALIAALVLAYAQRLRGGRALRGLVRVAAMGYAVPGSVIAIAIIVPFAWFDNTVLDPLFGTGLLLSGSLLILIYAYLVRFLAVALGSTEHGLASITPSMEQAARSLGAGPLRSLWQIHLPLMRASLATAALLVIVDVLKELPATMLLRPFHLTTLAVRVHEQVSQESLEHAALPALLIVATGLIPVLVLTAGMARPRSGVAVEAGT